MTLPIAPVHINPPVVQQQQTPAWVTMVFEGIREGRDLQLRWAKLRQEQQEFEARRGLIGEQTEALKLANKQKKDEFKAREDDLMAQNEAHRIYIGSLPDGKFDQAIVGIKDPAIANHFMEYVKRGFAIQQQQADIGATQALEFQRRQPPPGQFTHIGQTPEGTPVKMETHTGQITAGGPTLREPGAVTKRIPVLGEREKASAAVSSIRADSRISELERADPTIGARVANKAARYKATIAGLGKRLIGTPQEEINQLAEAEIEKSMVGDELEYYVTGKQLLSGILPGLSGKQVTAREYMMHAPGYLSMGSTNPRVTESRRKARNTRIRSFIAEAGEAMAERIPELQGIDLSPYGLGTVLLPDSTQMEITPGRARFHPKFNVRP